MPLESSEYEPRASQPGTFRLAKRAAYRHFISIHADMARLAEHMKCVEISDSNKEGLDPAERITFGLYLNEHILQHRFFIQILIGECTMVEEESHGPRITFVSETKFIDRPEVIDIIRKMRADYRLETSEKIHEMGLAYTIGRFAEEEQFDQIPLLEQDLSILRQMIMDGRLTADRIHVPEKIGYSKAQ